VSKAKYLEDFDQVLQDAALGREVYKIKVKLLTKIYLME
jgi:hypothetical protein